jgi:hypothetical protein
MMTGDGLISVLDPNNVALRDPETFAGMGTLTGASSCVQQVVLLDDRRRSPSNFDSAASCETHQRRQREVRDRESEASTAHLDRVGNFLR